MTRTQKWLVGVATCLTILLSPFLLLAQRVVSNFIFLGTVDASSAVSFRLPVAAGLTTTTNGLIGYNSTLDQLKAAIAGTDRILVWRATPIPTSGNCAQWGGSAELTDAGSPCGSGGGGASASLQLTDVKPTVAASNMALAAGTYGNGTVSYTVPARTFTLVQCTVTAITPGSPTVVSVSGCNVPSNAVHANDMISITSVVGNATMMAAINIPNNLVINQTGNPATAFTLATNTTGGTYTSGGCLGCNGSASGDTYFYGTPTGILIAEHPTAAGLIIVPSSQTFTGVRQAATTSFNSSGTVPGNTPLAVVSLSTASNGSFTATACSASGALPDCIDARHFMGGQPIVAGYCATAVEAGGLVTVGVDPACGIGIVQPTSLTDNGTVIATNAAVCLTNNCNFRVTALTANVTLSNPTNLTNGQVITWEVIQNASAAKTLAYGALFAFGTEVTGCTISAGLSTHSFITAVYNSTAAKLYVRGCLTGF